jgi:hypothetical protein
MAGMGAHDEFSFWNMKICATANDAELWMAQQISEFWKPSRSGCRVSEKLQACFAAAGL